MLKSNVFPKFFKIDNEAEKARITRGIEILFHILIPNALEGGGVEYRLPEEQQKGKRRALIETEMDKQFTSDVDAVSAVFQAMGLKENGSFFKYYLNIDVPTRISAVVMSAEESIRELFFLSVLLIMKPVEQDAASESYIISKYEFEKIKPSYGYDMSCFGADIIAELSLARSSFVRCGINLTKDGDYELKIEATPQSTVGRLIQFDKLLSYRALTA